MIMMSLRDAARAIPRHQRGTVLTFAARSNPCKAPAFRWHSLHRPRLSSWPPGTTGALNRTTPAVALCFDARRRGRATDAAARALSTRPPQPPRGRLASGIGMLGAGGMLLLGKGKYLLGALKLTKFASLGSMVLTVGTYTAFCECAVVVAPCRPRASNAVRV